MLFSSSHSRLQVCEQKRLSPRRTDEDCFWLTSFPHNGPPHFAGMSAYFLLSLFQGQGPPVPGSGTGDPVLENSGGLTRSDRSRAHDVRQNARSSQKFRVKGLRGLVEVRQFDVKAKVFVTSPFLNKHISYTHHNVAGCA